MNDADMSDVAQEVPRTECVVVSEEMTLAEYEVQFAREVANYTLLINQLQNRLLAERNRMEV